MKMGVSCPAENEDSLASQPKQHLIIPMSQTRNKSRNKIFFVRCLRNFIRHFITQGPIFHLGED